MAVTGSNLKSFIAEAVKKGMSLEELYEMLVHTGWPEKIVKQYIGLHKKLPSSKEVPLISVQGVTKSFQETEILHNLNLNVYDREMLGLIGASGVGKTTLLNIIVGFIEPDAGDVILNLKKEAFSTYKNPEKVKMLFGFSTQTPSFYESLTVLENLKYYSSLYGIKKDAQKKLCRSLIAMVNLQGSENTISRNLSGHPVT